MGGESGERERKKNDNNKTNTAIDRDRPSLCFARSEMAEREMCSRSLWRLKAAGALLGPDGDVPPRLRR